MKELETRKEQILERPAPKSVEIQEIKPLRSSQLLPAALCIQFYKQFSNNLTNFDQLHGNEKFAHFKFVQGSSHFLSDSLKFHGRF